MEACDAYCQTVANPVDCGLTTSVPHLMSYTGNTTVVTSQSLAISMSDCTIAARFVLTYIL